MSVPAATPVPSPCVSRCRIDPRLGYCIGCGRNRDEIAAWLGADAATRQAIAQRAAGRLAAGPGTDS
ncbi:DUF1289 domain-containing protein [Phaeospirillum tilakii]|uniref:DUF1289 domain-containing protein n=1 Tax=Phaeospirillum tilakii TaxID=741673 RepID=A0ABW5C9W1_9PROT